MSESSCTLYMWFFRYKEEAQRLYRERVACTKHHMPNLNRRGNRNQALFLWIVRVINISLGKGEENLPFIGVLDIFGEIVSRLPAQSNISGLLCTLVSRSSSGVISIVL